MGRKRTVCGAGSSIAHALWRICAIEAAASECSQGKRAGSFDVSAAGTVRVPTAILLIPRETYRGDCHGGEIPYRYGLRLVRRPAESWDLQIRKPPRRRIARFVGSGHARSGGMAARWKYARSASREGFRGISRAARTARGPPRRFLVNLSIPRYGSPEIKKRINNRRIRWFKFPF